MASTGKPALSDWLIEHRKAKRLPGSSEGLTVLDVAKLVGRSEATVRGWEAGRPPKADSQPIRLLEQLYGASAPGDDEDTGLVAALNRQSEAIEALVGLLAPLVEQQDRRLAVLEPVVARLAERVLEAPTTQPAPHRTKG